MVGARGRAISPKRRSVRASRLIQKDRASGEGCALRAALLSALVPEAGQLYLGRRRRGLAMVAITALPVGVGGGLWLLDPILVLSWLVQPRVLLGLLVLRACFKTAWLGVGCHRSHPWLTRPDADFHRPASAALRPRTGFETSS